MSYECNGIFLCFKLQYKIISIYERKIAIKNDILDKNLNVDNIYNDIKTLINHSKEKIYKTVNTEMLLLYWHIGKIIMEIQGGNKRAKYGYDILEKLSIKLTNEFGSGFSERNLRRIRKFYELFPNWTSLMSNLTWTHYTEIIKIKEEHKRNFYFHECINSRWSVRELQRQIKSKLYDRLIITKHEEKKEELYTKGLIINNGTELLKDPYVLEFLGLNKNITEKELEDKIINNLKEFLLELGKGYMFVGRQLRINIENKHYYPDLVFYNNITKNYLLIDLKIGEFNHKDIGQMQIYVNYYDKKVKKENENDTVGLILCASKNEVIVKYTLPKSSNIYVSKYLLQLPKEEDLINLVNKELNN